MGSKLPAFQFYPGDWLRDPGVQSLSYHDRGVWFEMLCRMHDSERRGALVLNGAPMSDEILAGILRLDLETLRGTVTTLLQRGITERDRTGALINRRMIRDEESRAKGRAKLSNWRKSKKDKENCNRDVTIDETVLKPLSSSSSSSSSSKTNTKTKAPRAAFELPPWIPRDAWDGFLEMRRKKRVPNTDRALKGIVTILDKLRAAGFESGEVLDQSTQRGWTGVFEIKSVSGGNGNGTVKSHFETRGEATERILRELDAEDQERARGSGGVPARRA